MSVATPEECYEGLAECYQTIEEIQAIILGEPTAIHIAPAIYTTIRGLNEPLTNLAPSTSTMGGDQYTFTSRLVLFWQENQEAERQLLRLVKKIPASVAANPRLNGRLYSGIAQMTSGTDGYINISGTWYRVFDFVALVTVKG